MISVVAFKVRLGAEALASITQVARMIAFFPLPIAELIVASKDG
jgi:hypothetical protein